MSWDDDLEPDEREQWNTFVRHVREDTVKKMSESAFVMHLVPDAADVDIKFAVELGLSIMLDKPCLAVVMPGTEVPPRLRLVCDRIVELDMDTEEGRERLTAAIAEMKELS